MKGHSPYWAKIEDMRAIKGNGWRRGIGRLQREEGCHKRVKPSADRSAKKSLCPVIATMQRERLNYDYVKQLRQ